MALHYEEKTESFLNHLALKAKVATSIQYQALSTYSVSEPMGQNRVKNLTPLLL
jgi:hypothetical protein